MWESLVQPRLIPDGSYDSLVHACGQSHAVGQKAMRELLDQDGAGGEAAEHPSNDDSTLSEEEIGAIRQRTATFLLGEGRWGMTFWRDVIHSS